MTTEFLHWARPLHPLHNPNGSMLWAALTIGHYVLFQSGKLAQPRLAEARAAKFIRVWDIAPHFMQGCLHFVSIKLSDSKTDPFQLGCPAIIGCTRTAVCGTCEAWCTVQSHRCKQMPPNAPFLQVDGRALDCLMLVNHIQGHCGQARTQLLQVLWTQPMHQGSHICSASRALPVADQTIRLVEQPGLSALYPSGSAYMCGFCCLHDS